MTRPDILPTATIARIVGPPDRRWIPTGPDNDELLEIHQDLRGGGYEALARIVASPIAQAYTAARADEVIADGLGRLLDEIRYGDELEEGDDE